MNKGFEDWKKFGYRGWWKFGFTFWVGKRWGCELFLGPFMIVADSRTIYYREGHNPMPPTDRKIALLWLRRDELAEMVEAGKPYKTWVHPSWIEGGHDKRATEYFD